MRNLSYREGNNKMKIGVITDCFKKPLAESIVLAGEMGMDGVQIYATKGEFSPDTLDAQAKSKYKKLLRENNLVVSALCGDMGGYGFSRAADNAERILKTKRIIDLAVEFETKVVTTHIGVIPSDKRHERYKVLLSALRECGHYAAGKGVTLAIETGPEKADTLRAFLSDTDGGVGVNLDPANFVMVTGQDPAEAVRILKDYIVHTHVKDGVMITPGDPEQIYNAFAKGGIEALEACEHFKETPVGEGGVDFKAYFAALKEAGYDGFLTIERETGSEPLKDIRQAYEFCRSRW